VSGASTGKAFCGVGYVCAAPGDGTICAGVYRGGALSGVPLYPSSCKISAKSDNLRPSYSDLLTMAAVCHLGCLKEASGTSGTQLLAVVQ